MYTILTLHASSYLLWLPFDLSSENYKEDEARLRFSVRVSSQIFIGSELCFVKLILKYGNILLVL